MDNVKMSGEFSTPENLVTFITELSNGLPVIKFLILLVELLPF